MFIGIFCTNLSIGKLGHTAESVSLQLNEEHQLQYAGFYTALWRDLYTSAGLDVDIRPAHSNSNPDEVIETVINGEADFGVASVELLAAYGDSKSVIAYSTFFQLSDITLYVHEHTLISTVNDLAKLRLTVPPGTKYELPLQYLLSQTDSADSQHGYTVSNTPLLDLIEGRTDVIMGSSLTTPYLAERLDLQLKPIPLQKFGLDLPGLTLFSNREFYEKKRNVVDKFVFASLKGWQLGLERTDEIALELTRRKMAQSSTQSTFGMSFFQADQIRKLSMYPVVTPGAISIERWKKAHRKFLPLLDSKIPLAESFIHDPVIRLQNQANFIGTLLKVGIPIVLILAGFGICHTQTRRANHIKYEAILRKQATHDSLTGLPNRQYAFNKLDDWLKHSRSARQPFHVMFLDLDGFKAVNDTASHAIGDKLLLRVAERLDSVLGKTDWLARIGGDEFLVLSKAQKESDINLVTSSILNTLKEPFIIEDNEFLIGTSIGIANYPDHGKNGQLLLSHADEAMYQAKASGKNRSVMYTEELSIRAREKVDIGNRLRNAISQNELFLCYQPIISIKTGKIIGAEALLRWKNPVLGMISPDRFIPIAEEMGIIIEIGEWVLDKALSDMNHWNSLSTTPVYVSVNVSPRQFQKPHLVDHIFSQLSKKKISPRLLKLEITENLLINDKPETATLLTQLDQGGIDIFLDDFGTGYSSLSYLKNFPIKVVKIDREFINDIATDKKNKSLVNAIVALARGLDMTVVGEGVETSEQLGLLKQLSCDYAQGYLLSKPLEKSNFLKYLACSTESERSLAEVS